MRANGSIQFKGIDKVVTAYINNDVPIFALFCGRQLLTKYEGEDIQEGANFLREFLENLDKGSATYALCVYEDPGTKVKSNTPYDGSFNFKLEEKPYPSQSITGLDERVNNRVADLENKFNLLMQKLDEQDKEELEESAPGGLGAVLNGLLENPEIQRAIASRVIGLVDKILPAPAADPGLRAVPSEGLGKVGSVQNGPAQQVNQLTSSEIDRLNQAIEILAKHDQLLGSHLAKLALVAETEPGKFKMILGLLKTL